MTKLCGVARRALCGAAATAALGAWGPTASAQGTSPMSANDAANGPIAVQEIVVTAQRREEKLTDVPVSVSAVTGKTLETLGVTDAAQLAALVPGLNYSNTGPIPVFSIRGITLNDYGMSNESPIAFYLDDVYLAPPSSITAQMFDVQRVEVLRGPQGTLFGRNATGGLVQVISNKPTNAFAGDASIQYGSNDEVVANAAIGGPISNRLRVRAAFTYDRDDGWQYNAYLNTRQARTNTWAGRVIVDFDVTSRLLSELNIHGGFQDNTTPGYYNRGEFTLAGAMCSVDQIIANLCYSPFGSRDPNPQPGVVYSDFANPHNRARTIGVDEALKYSGDGFAITSISAYERSNKFYQEDSDGSPDPLIASENGLIRTQYSEELRANGARGPVRWLVGGFIFRETGDDGTAILYQIVPLYGTYGDQNNFFENTTSGAVFGQLDYDLLSNLTLTGGARFTSETKHLTISDDFADPTYVDHDSASTNRVTWKAGLEWRLQPDWMAYASVSTGFKSQAFDTTLVLQGGAVAAKPETDTNYEIGTKAEVFDRRLQLSADVFYLTYRNFQLVTIPPACQCATSELLNAEGATIYGAEAEANAVPFRGLTLNLSATALHTRINAPGLTVGPFPLTGAQLAYSPDFALKGYARYDVDIGGLGVLSPYADFVYNSKDQSQVVLDPLTVIPSYIVANTGIEYTPIRSKFSIDFFVDNVGNKSYITYAGDFFGYNILQWAKPRTWGVRLSAKW